MLHLQVANVACCCDMECNYSAISVACSRHGSEKKIDGKRNGGVFLGDIGVGRVIILKLCQRI